MFVNFGQNPAALGDPIDLTSPVRELPKTNVKNNEKKQNSFEKEYEKSFAESVPKKQLQNEKNPNTGVQEVQNTKQPEKIINSAHITKKSDNLTKVDVPIAEALDRSKISLLQPFKAEGNNTALEESKQSFIDSGALKISELEDFLTMVNPEKGILNLKENRSLFSVDGKDFNDRCNVFKIEDEKNWTVENPLEQMKANAAFQANPLPYLSQLQSLENLSAFDVQNVQNEVRSQNSISNIMPLLENIQNYFPNATIEIKEFFNVDDASFEVIPADSKIFTLNGSVDDAKFVNYREFENKNDKNIFQKIVDIFTPDKPQENVERENLTNIKVHIIASDKFKNNEIINVIVPNKMMDEAYENSIRVDNPLQEEGKSIKGLSMSGLQRASMRSEVKIFDLNQNLVSNAVEYLNESQSVLKNNPEMIKSQPNSLNEFKQIKNDFVKSDNVGSDDFIRSELVQSEKNIQIHKKDKNLVLQESDAEETKNLETHKSGKIMISKEQGHENKNFSKDFSNEKQSGFNKKDDSSLAFVDKSEMTLTRTNSFLQNTPIVLDKNSAEDYSFPIVSETTRKAIDLSSQLQARGGGIAKIEIQDATLGKIELNIQMKRDNTVTMEIKTNNIELKSVLEGNSESLKKSLDTQNISLTDFKVTTIEKPSSTHANSGGQMAFQNQNFQSQDQQQSNSIVQQNGSSFSQSAGSQSFFKNQDQDFSEFGQSNNAIKSNSIYKKIDNNVATNIQRGANGSIKVMA